jgi:quinol monooxygenase YgiN
MPDKQAEPIRLINVFTVAASDQQRLIDLLVRATEGWVVRAPGFLGATLHRGLDGTQVTMVSEWRSLSEYQAMRRDPGALPLFQEMLAFAAFAPGVYEVVRRFLPESG